MSGLIVRLGLRRTAQRRGPAVVEADSVTRLTPDEDEELRRLAALADYGALTPALADVYDELRSRDRRRTVREPRVVAVPYPRESTDGAMGAARR